jgi:hypothetical protein
MMNAHYDRIGQLAQQHHHEMLAEARQRQLLHEQGSPAPRTPRASAITRRLSAAIARIGAAAARVPAALRPARP